MPIGDRCLLTPAALLLSKQLKLSCFMSLPLTVTRTMTHFPGSSSRDDSQPHSNQIRQELNPLYSLRCPTSIPTLSLQHHHLDNHVLTIHHECIATLTSHNSYISSLTIGQNFLLTGSSERELRLWKCKNLNSKYHQENIAENTVITGKGAVKSLVLLTDKLFSAHQDNKIRVWKINDDETHRQKFTHLATLPTLSDRAFKLLLPKNHVQVRRHKKSTWVHHVDTVSALALSSDESLLYSVSWDRTLKIWRTTDFKCLESVANAHDDAINALAVSIDGGAYTGSADRKIKLWRKGWKGETHSLAATLENHESGVNALALSTDGNVLYSAASDKSIIVWEKLDENHMMAVGALKGHTKSILCLAVVSDLVCSGSADKTIRIWKGINKCYNCLAVLEGHKGPVKCITIASEHYNPNEASSFLIYSSSLDCDIKVWQILSPPFHSNS